MITLKKRASLLSMLICLTLIMIATQISFFLIHYKVSDLVDSLVKSSMSSQIYHTVIIFPIINFLLIQIGTYILFTTWVWFIATSSGEWFKLSTEKTYWGGILFWFITCCMITALNNYFFSDSFFSYILNQNGLFNYHLNIFIIFATCGITLILTSIAYLNFFLHKRHLVSGGLFLTLGIITGFISFYNIFIAIPTNHTNQISKPNIIFIGLDSVRPDFTHYFGNTKIQTPNIDAFLQSSVVFNKSYAPMARTFPAWISILTAKYPKDSHARSNLSDPDLILPNDNLAKRLQNAGYETIYGTDEKRFSNITENYGFDHIIGPSIGINDFLLGNLGDFPLSNLLINSPLGKFLFPYNYANRAAAITYEPQSFTELVQLELAKKHDKPLFLAIHLCISHWPYTWAHDGQERFSTLARRYQSSVEAVDQQLGQILAMLKTAGLLDNSIVVLLSDHGTTLGLHNDRVISRNNYVGDLKNIKIITHYKLGTAPRISLNPKKDFSIDTSYGQGTDVLSLKQNHTLLAIKATGLTPHRIETRVTLLDISPTILELLKLNPLQKVDGVSLYSWLTDSKAKNILRRPLYLESGYTISEIETNDIFITNVLHKAIGAYAINPKNGFLFVKPEVERSIVKNKQRAVLLGDWLLARYPAKTQMQLSLPKSTGEAKVGHVTSAPYFVLVNLKTKQWTVGLTGKLAKLAPVAELVGDFNKFYGSEARINRS